MATTGPNGITSAANVSGAGTAIWLNPTNATALDGSTSIAGMVSGVAESQYLRGTALGFSIPSSDAIVGLLLEALVRVNNPGDLWDVRFYPVLNNVIQSQWGSGQQVSSTSVLAFSQGGPSSLPTSLTPSDVNNANFGFAIRATDKNQNLIARCDYMRVTVYHAPPLFPRMTLMGVG